MEPKIDAVDRGQAGEPIEILLVEDNEDDAELTLMAFAKARFVNHVNVVTDGDAAVRYLQRQGEYASAVRPDIVLLDLNLPGLDGREVLERIKTNDDLKAIPVIVLTSSEADEDVLRSYRLHANSYLTKPVRFREFLDAVAVLTDYWITIVKLPPKG